MGESDRYQLPRWYEVIFWIPMIIVIVLLELLGLIEWFGEEDDRW